MIWPTASAKKKEVDIVYFKKWKFLPTSTIIVSLINEEA